MKVKCEEVKRKEHPSRVVLAPGWLGDGGGGQQKALRSFPVLSCSSSLVRQRQGPPRTKTDGGCKKWK